MSVLGLVKIKRKDAMNKRMVISSDVDTQDYVCSISSTEFEVFCKEVLQEFALDENLNDFGIEHNVKIDNYDGVYQIDIYAHFTAMGTEFKVLCECKQYSNTVKRETVQILYDKVKTLGVHKGILLSTSGFQKGAIEYAKKHGIALIQVYDHSCVPVSHSSDPNISTDEDINDPLLYCEKNWPKYRAICFMPDNEGYYVVFPTRKMVDDIYSKMSEVYKEVYGFEMFSKKDKSND